jgi:transcriptional regulator GlxA family with amidase domain
VNSLQEHAITLLLEKHPHNYSAFLQDDARANARVIQEAKHYIEQNADKPITVSDVSRAVGCGMRALHQGFCEIMGVTPRAYLHHARMAKARESLQAGGTEYSAAEVAGKYGFTDYESFSSSYKRRYDELPSETFDRNFGVRAALEALANDHRSALSPTKIDLLRHHINANLGNQITVQSLASLVGMSSQSFAAAFKNAFRTTPAQYVLSERVKWASWLLANTNFSIAAIAAETGFSSQSHLTSAMGNVSGQTPFEFRRLSNLR